MPQPLAFDIASFALFSDSQFAAKQKGALLLLTDKDGKPAAEACRLTEAEYCAALSADPRFERKAFAHICSVLPAAAGFSHLILVNAAGAENFGEEDWLKLGGSCAQAANGFDIVTIGAALPAGAFNEAQLAQFLCGFKLGHYRFDKYKTDKKDKSESGMTVNIAAQNTESALRALNSAQILAESVILARNLVNEPANILGTEEFVAHIRNLSLLGVEVEILDKAALEQAGLRALLAVAQGSRRPPYLAVMRWNGGAEGEAPLALIGKGVVFDSGGISLKPAAKMEEMKGDMGGAAAVVGAMHALAARRAKVNIVGIVGLVENMPDGLAQRPGDIVTSLSGQTIEVINTDAEGRLVLADVLWFAKENLKPKLMIDLATLTGAVVVALGSHYAGLYSNDKELSAKLAQAGEQTGELLWPMPLSPAYDKIVDSAFADMRNSCGREAGSITAAQFLQRFVGETPWAHLDIAGTASGAEKTAYNQSWATGFGVRLLNRFIAEFYEAKQV